LMEVRRLSVKRYYEADGLLCVGHPDAKFFEACCFGSVVHTFSKRYTQVIHRKCYSAEEFVGLAII
jgi:hypothetical protein